MLFGKVGAINHDFFPYAMLKHKTISKVAKLQLQICDSMSVNLNVAGAWTVIGHVIWQLRPLSRAKLVREINSSRND